MQFMDWSVQARTVYGPQPQYFSHVIIKW